MFAHHKVKPNSWTKKGWGLILVVLLAACILMAINASPASASIPPESISDDAVIYLPVVTAAASCGSSSSPRTPNLFGVQMYGNTSNTGKFFQDMMDSNTSWVRAEVAWSQIEPVNVEPAEFKWERTDRAMAAAVQGGINMIGTINHNPAWAAEHPPGPIHPEHLDDFVQFFTAVVERYDGDGIDDDPCGRVVKVWELYNEPDNVVHWGHDGDQYANMLARAYPAIKAADPEAQIAFGGIAYEWFTDENVPGPFVRSFTTDVLDAGGGAFFDIMNFHAYPPFAPAWTAKGPGVYEKTEFFRTLLGSYGLSKPIIITEAGAHSNDAPASPSTPEIQASYVVELFTQAKAADVMTMIWFMLYDPSEDYPYRNGLVTASTPPVRKLAFSTYQQTVEQLTNADFDRVLADDELGAPEMLAYRFVKSNTGAPFYVVWMNPVKTDQTATFTIPGAQATVYDIRTNTHTVNDGDDGNNDGQLSITVGREPLMIEVGQ